MSRSSQTLKLEALKSAEHHNRNQVFFFKQTGCVFGTSNCKKFLCVSQSKAFDIHLSEFFPTHTFRIHSFLVDAVAEVVK